MIPWGRVIVLCGAGVCILIIDRYAATLGKDEFSTFWLAFTTVVVGILALAPVTYICWKRRERRSRDRIERIESFGELEAALTTVLRCLDSSIRLAVDDARLAMVDLPWTALPDGLRRRATEVCELFVGLDEDCIQSDDRRREEAIGKARLLLAEVRRQAHTLSEGRSEKLPAFSVRP